MKRHIFYLAVIAVTTLSAGFSSFSSSAADECVSQPSSATSSAASAKPAVTEVAAHDPAPIAANRPVVIDFYATWCHPCKTYSPIFEKVAKDYGKKADFMSVDIEKCRDLAEQYGVSTIPTTIILMPDGHIYKAVGAISDEQLRYSLDTVLK